MEHTESFSHYYLVNDLKTDTYYSGYEQSYLRSSWASQWNWAAGIFGMLWLIYRKAYRALFIAVLLKLLVASLFGPVSFLVSFILFAMFGNNLYFWDIRMRIIQASQTTGTSSLLVLFAAPLLCGIFLITFFIFPGSQVLGLGFLAVVLLGLLLAGGGLLTVLLVSIAIVFAKLAGLLIPFAKQASQWVPYI